MPVREATAPIAITTEPAPLRPAEAIRMEAVRHEPMRQDPVHLSPIQPRVEPISDMDPMLDDPKAAIRPANQT